RGLRLGEPDRLPASVRQRDEVVLVVLLDKMARAFDCGGINDRVQQVWIEIEGVLPHRIVKAVVDRQYAAEGQSSVLFDEVTQQVVKVPDRVVDRRGREQQQVAARPSKQLTQHAGAGLGAGVAIVVRFVNNNEGVLVKLGAKVIAVAAKLPVAGQLLIRYARDK